MDLLNKNGEMVLHGYKKILSFLAHYYIDDDKGNLIAEIKRVFGLVPKFSVSIRGKELEVKGNLLAHSFQIIQGGESVASIKKQYISWGDTYEITIEKEEDIQLFLFIVIVIDQVVHENKGNSHFSSSH